MPQVELGTYLITIKHQLLNSHELHEALRVGKPAVIGRINKDKLLLDLRTVSEDEQVSILERLVQIDEG